MPENINQAVLGLNLDSVSHQIKEGSLTYAYNAVVKNFDGQTITYQNEVGNTICVQFPSGYKLIGGKNIPELKQVYYFLVNPVDGTGEIGYSNYGDCSYYTLISDKDSIGKFNFSIEFPIHKVVVKTTNCSTQLYWTEGLHNTMRYLDLTELPWKEERNPNNDFKPVKIVGQLDPNKLRVQPDFNIPEIEPKEVSFGGALQMGTYQFAIQYSNSLGEGYTSYFSPTNPISIFQNRMGGNDLGPTNKSIKLEILGLDTSGVYDFYNIAVIKTVNMSSSAYLVGTFPIIAQRDEFTYTGVEASPIQLDIQEILIKYPHYDMAEDIYEVDHCLGWDSLYSDDEINYQQIWNEVDTYWETYQLPYNQFEGYVDGINAALYRSYMRDEVYPLEGYFILKSGRQTKSFHIPGRIAKERDLEVVFNNDTITEEDPCQEKEGLPRWKVYNTGLAFEVNENVKEDDCYIGPYQMGEMSYWESFRKYPNNPEIWGDLANKPIRHHKFPDNIISPHFSNNPSNDRSFTHYIYPIGVKIRTDSLMYAIKHSSLTQAQKDDIVGFGIARGNRAGGNYSVVAKGIFNNVGKYEFEDKEYFYANYPYNDLRPDPFFAKEKLQHHAGYRPDKALHGFGEWSKSRFAFHSPDTHFDHIVLGDILKLEGIVHGKSYGHFVQVKNNAEYKFLTREAYATAAAVALATGITLGGGSFGLPSFSLSQAPMVYNSMMEILEKLMPFTNFGYSFNSIGFYENFYPVPNEGNKIRRINTAKYIADGFKGVEPGATINNFHRESSVYIHSDGNLLFPTDYDSSIPQDTSRYSIMTSGANANTWADFFTLFKNSNSQIITDQFIKDTFYSLMEGSQSESYIYYFTQKVIFSGTTPPIPATYQPVLGSIYNDPFGNIYRIKHQFTSAPVLTGPNYVINTIHAELLTKGTQDPPNTSGVLTLDPSNTVPSLSIVSYINVEPVPSSYFYSQFIDEYVNDIRTVFQEFLLDLSLIDGPFDITSNSGYVYNMAALTYYAAYTDYVGALPKQTPTKEREADISTYYGSIKRNLLDQWGAIYSYETISTGYYQDLYDDNGAPILDYPTIFGGDTYITQFTHRSKVPFFISNTVGKSNGADINYDELANYGYPMYWASTKPIQLNVSISNKAEKAVGRVLKPNFGEIVGAILSGGISIIAPVLDLLNDVFGAIFKILGIKNVNLDNYKKNDLIEQGIMYLFAHGLPTYFVESTVNTEYRYATNETYGNFYPNVGSDIPDEWLQEVTTPIVHDNSYNYDYTYNKQNKENIFSHLREDFDPNKKCLTAFPNRTFWSNKSQLEESRNNWLIYRPASRYDLPKSFGKLISIDSLENNSLLVRYENSSQIYNSLVTVDTSTFTAFIGNDKLFSGSKPIDLSRTEIGSCGSQHKFILKTDNGVVYIDSIRGQVLLLVGTQIEDLAQKGMVQFFTNNLPFQITKSIPNVPIDNHALGIGITGVYDRPNRIIITKLDYEPLVPITYVDGKFYEGEQEIQLRDSSKFKDCSWTLSYSFITQSWTSFHGYKPNHYISYPNYFHTVINNDLQVSTWEHETSFTVFNSFYNTISSYILEYPFNSKAQDEILSSVQDYCSARIYSDVYTYTEPDTTLYFNKCIISNDQQCTGVLSLIPQNNNDLSQQYLYPNLLSDSKEILVCKSDNFYQFNDFWNILKDPSNPIFLQCKVDDKCLNSSNLDYTLIGYETGAIRGKNCRIRLILDNKDNVHLISKFIISTTQVSYK